VTFEVISGIANSFNSKVSENKHILVRAYETLAVRYEIIQYWRAR